MTRVAAIDCGTNSIRLLIADVDVEALTISDIDRRMEIVRLGQGVDKTGHLAEDALDRTFAACDSYVDAIADANVGAVRFVATSASRDADNSAVFVAGVRDRFGVDPEIISGEEEAELSFTGATRSLSDVLGNQVALVVDIGGGSTEFVVGTARQGVTSSRSVDIGCVRITERRLTDDPPTSHEIELAVDDIDAAISEAAEFVDMDSADVLVGLAGSVTTVGAINLGLDAYDADATHRTEITAAEVHEISNRLLTMSRAERSEIKVMHPGRVDVIGAGALILDRVVTITNMSSVVISEHDILDGIAWSIA